ncbi:hypothetical protein WJ968_11240 [Achromobacter xylosoxidans]
MDTTRSIEGLEGEARLVIAATETEDELGTVLRLHLLIEAFLDELLGRQISADLKPFIPTMRSFSDKLGYAYALGLPLSLAAVVRQINGMRNKLAHRDSSGINPGDAKELARLTEKLACLVEGEEWLPLNRRFMEIPEKAPGRRFLYGEGNLRVDFIICFSGFWYIALRYLALFAANHTTAHKGSAGSRRR